MNDKRHRELVNSFLGYVKKRNLKYDVEQPYNWYGSRGIVDVVVYDKNGYNLVECKPRLDDVGGAIRQVNKQERYYPLCYGVSSYKVRSWLLFPFDSHNEKIMHENINLLSKVNIIIFNGKEFYFYEKEE